MKAMRLTYGCSPVLHMWDGYRFNLMGNHQVVEVVVGPPDDGKNTVVVKLLREGEYEGWTITGATVRQDGNAILILGPEGDAMKVAWLSAIENLFVSYLQDRRHAAYAESVGDEETAACRSEGAANSLALMMDVRCGTGIAPTRARHGKVVEEEYY